MSMRDEKSPSSLRGFQKKCRATWLFPVVGTNENVGGMGATLMGHRLTRSTNPVYEPSQAQATTAGASRGLRRRPI